MWGATRRDRIFELMGVVMACRGMVHQPCTMRGKVCAMRRKVYRHRKVSRRGECAITII